MQVARWKVARFRFLYLSVCLSIVLWVCVCVCVSVCVLFCFFLLICFPAGSADNKIVIWDASTWIVHQVLATPAAHVLSLSWWRVWGKAEGTNIDNSSGGSHVLVAGTWEGQVLMWVGSNSSAAQGEL